MIDFFTSSNGRISGVFRAPKKHLSCVQPFQPLLISWRGSGDLKTILSSELNSQALYTLTGEKLFCGFYLNELLQRVLPVDDCYGALFLAYEKSLFKLSQAGSSQNVESVLRQFEFFLLSEMGFALNFDACSVSGNKFVEHATYQLVHGEGFVAVNTKTIRACALVFDGGDLIAISRQDYSKISTLRAAKQITRQSLKFLLGDKPLKSREMFR